MRVSAFSRCCSYLLLVSCSLFLAFASCKNPIIEDWYKTEGAAPQPGVAPQSAALLPVYATDLTYLVPAPHYGGTPVTGFTGPQYTGGVHWFEDSPAGSSHSGEFAATKVYAAVVTLEAAAGWTLSGAEANAFTHGDAPPPDGSVTNAAGSGLVTIIFPATGSTAAATVNTDLSGTITAPASYGVPQGSVDSTEYQGNIVWKSTLDGTDPGTIFLPAVAYTATITLTAKSSFTFGPTPGSLVFHHTGQASTPATVDNMDGTITITINFQPTGSSPVTDLALTYNVPAPVYGSTPVTSFGGPQYTGIVDWWNVTDGLDHAPDTDPFAPGKVYRATVTLTAAGGWTLADVLADTFGHAGASTVTNTAGNPGPVIVTITYPATGVVPVPKVTDLALTYNVPAPFAYGSPVTSFTGSQYTGMVEWYVGEGTTGTPHSGGLFHPNTIYTAKVSMLPLAGWTFSGLAANVFTHQAVAPAKISYTAGSQIVVIKFPKPGATVW
jgi:hypothetical protein